MELQLFCTNSGRSLRWERFKRMELGQLHQAIPFDELAALFPTQSLVGAPRFFDVKGMIALQVLKSVLGLSDDMLRQSINTDWRLQMFCGIDLGEHREIKDKDIVGRCRRWVAKHIDYEAFQKNLIQHWKPWMKQTAAVVMDATCYEVKMRYPTDVKLLYESCDWLWGLIDFWCLQMNIRKIRRKDKEVFAAYISYAKMKRKRRVRRLKVTRRLLNLLAKGLQQWSKLKQQFGDRIILNQRTKERKDLIELVFAQQLQRFEDPKAKIKGRILSLYQPWVRPIVRGKEIKMVEFGAKVHCFMIDGISFVEHFSFEAFHEGNRLKETVIKIEESFGKCRYLGADGIYPTNDNRRFCTGNGITTTFPRKGPKVKESEDKKKIKAALNAARSGQLEGSFGNEKNHYGLQKVVAKREDTQKLMIHFGIWTASAQKIKRRQQSQDIKKAA